MMNLAGVTFNNEKYDGNENRQSILDYLVRTCHREVVTINLIRTTYNGEPAIKCREKSTKKIVGWIPKTRVQEVLAKKVTQMTGFIYGRTIKDNNGKPQFVYGMNLDYQKAPSSVQYQSIKEVCRRQVLPMPAYDIRAYYAFSNLINDFDGIKSADIRRILNYARLNALIITDTYHEELEEKIIECDTSPEEIKNALKSIRNVFVSSRY